VAIPHPLRTVSIALAGAVVYFALLWLFYAIAPYSVIPHWWRHFSPNAAVAVVTWFTLLNVGGAILAAIPVALGVVLTSGSRGVVLGLVIGVMPALYMAVRVCIEFGVPPTVEAWVADIAQFFAVSLAVVAVVALIRGFPLTIGSSDRVARLR
jgi:hypothetical protein